MSVRTPSALWGSGQQSAEEERETGRCVKKHVIDGIDVDEAVSAEPLLQAHVKIHT